MWHTRRRRPLPAVGDDGARRGRLGAAPRADAHPHRAARAVRRDLERVAQCRSPAGTWSRSSARMDFEFDPLPEGFGAARRGARQRRAGRRPADRGRRSCPATTAVEDEDLIRTKVNMIPESVHRDPRRRHRRPRQAGRRRHPRALDRRGRPHPGRRRPRPRARATSASASRSSMPDPARLRRAVPSPSGRTDRRLRARLLGAIRASRCVITRPRSARSGLIPELDHSMVGPRRW